MIVGIEKRKAVTASIGVRIRQRRKELGLSLSDLSTACGCSKTHIWDLERGKATNPSIWLLLALCDGLLCSLNFLMDADVSAPLFTENEMNLIKAHRNIFGVGK